MLVCLFESFTGVGFKALEECIFNLWAITVFIRETGYPLPKSKSVIKFNCFLVYGSEQILSTLSARDITGIFGNVYLFQFFYKMNWIFYVRFLEQIDISENSILSSFDIVSMHTSIDVPISEQLLQNKLENNYHLIEESAIADHENIDVLVQLKMLV